MGIEARGHMTSYRHAGTILQMTSSDVIMTVNGLRPRQHQNDSSASCIFREISDLHDNLYKLLGPDAFRK